MSDKEVGEVARNIAAQLSRLDTVHQEAVLLHVQNYLAFARMIGGEPEQEALPLETIPKVGEVIPKDEWLSVAKAAKLARIAVPTMYHAARRGRVNSKKIDGSLKILKTDAEHYGH